MGDAEKMTANCAVCLTEIQGKVDSLVEDIRGEWQGFLANADEKLNNSILHQEKESDKISTNSKWILGVVLGITFMLGTVVGFTWNEMQTKANRSEVLLVKEYEFIHSLTKAYNANQFVQNPNAKVDSTNYNLIIKAVLQGTMRGGE